MGNIYLCNQLTDRQRNHTFYPDILYRHPFGEAHLVTETSIIREGLPEMETLLHDMEGAAIYQAGSYFFGPHQMCFLKIVSDEGYGGEISPNRLREIMEQALGDVIEFLSALRQYQEHLLQREYPRGNYRNSHNATRECFEINQKHFDELCRELCCSQTMKNMLKQDITYCTLAGIDFWQIISQMRQEGKLPCRDKREGKKRLEEIRNETTT